MFIHPYNAYIVPYSTEVSQKDKYVNLIREAKVFFVVSWLLKKYKLLEAPKQIWRQTNKGALSLQQVLDSILNKDAENDVSEEESNEQEFDYNDMVKEGGQSVEFSDIILVSPLHQTFFYLVGMTTYLHQ